MTATVFMFKKYYKQIFKNLNFCICSPYIFLKLVDFLSSAENGLQNLRNFFNVQKTLV